MRRLTIPTLRDRDKIRVDVVVEVDDAPERVGDAGDAAQTVVRDGDVVAVAILDLRATVFVVDLDEAELRVVGRAQHKI